MTKYEQVKELVNKGMSLGDACKKIGYYKSGFYTTRARERAAHGASTPPVTDAAPLKRKYTKKTPLAQAACLLSTARPKIWQRLRGVCEHN